jgi:hypothetical protein
MGLAMPLFSFRTRCPVRSRVSEACEFESQAAAWSELTRVCGDLVGGIVRNHLEENAEWNMEVLDESLKPLFRISLVAEKLA